MKRFDRICRIVPAVALLACAAVSVSGCAVALIAGGAVGGYAVAQHINDDQKLRAEHAEKESNKGWFK